MVIYLIILSYFRKRYSRVTIDIGRGVRSKDTVELGRLNCPPQKEVVNENRVDDNNDE